MKKIIFLSITLMLLICNVVIGQEKKFIKKVVEPFNEKKYTEAQTELNDFVQKNGMTIYTKYYKALLYYETGPELWENINACYRILADFTDTDPKTHAANPKNISEKDFTFEPEIGYQLFPGFYSFINGKHELNMTKGKAFIDKYKYTCWYILKEKEYPAFLNKALNDDDLDVLYKIYEYDAFNDHDYIKNETFYKGNFKVPTKDIKAVEDRIPYVEQNYIKKGIGEYTNIINIWNNFYKITNMEVGEILLNKMKEKMDTDFEKYKISNDSLIKFVNIKNTKLINTGKETVVSLGWFYEINDFMVRKLGNSHSIKSDIDKYKDKAVTILWDSQKDKWSPEFENAKTENTIEAINTFINKWGNEPYDNVAEISKAKELLADLKTKKEQQELNRAEKEAADSFAAEEARKKLIKNEIDNILSVDEFNLKMNEILPNCIDLFPFKEVPDDDNWSPERDLYKNKISFYESLMKEDVVRYFNLTEKYNSDLKMKAFKKSEEYLNFLNKLKEEKQKLTNTVCFINPYKISKSTLQIKYDLKKKGFEFIIPYFGSGSDRYWFYGIYRNDLPCKYNNINGGEDWKNYEFSKNIFGLSFEKLQLSKVPNTIKNLGEYTEIIKYPYKFFFPVDETVGLKIEENIKDIKLVFLFKLKGVRPANDVDNMPGNKNIITTTGLHAIIYNKRTNEIYATKLFDKLPVTKKTTETKTTANEKIGTGVITGGQMDSGCSIIFIENEQKENSTFRIDVETLNGIQIFIANPDNESGYFNEKVISKKVRFTYKKFKDDLGNEFDVIKKIELIK